MRMRNSNIKGFGMLLRFYSFGFLHSIHLHRQQNLALLQTYGPNAFRIQNYLLEATVKQTEKTLEELKELIVEVNRERKNTQVLLSLAFPSRCFLIAPHIGSNWKTTYLPRNPVDGADLERPSD